MRLLLGPSILLAVTALTVTAACAQPTAFCPYGQTCQNAPPVPFPVINPVQGLSSLPAQLLGKSQPPPPPPAVGYAPIATPPPVLPPGINR